MSENSKFIVLLRGNDKDKVLAINPDTEFVLGILKQIENEGGLEGAPELVVNYVEGCKFDDDPRSILYLMLAFSTSKSPGWIVNYCEPISRGHFYVLAASRPEEIVFERRTCCGVVSEYDSECIINDSSIIRLALSHFLANHGAHPKMHWVDYDEMVKDVGNMLF